MLPQICPVSLSIPSQNIAVSLYIQVCGVGDFGIYSKTPFSFFISAGIFVPSEASASYEYFPEVSYKLASSVSENLLHLYLNLLEFNIPSFLEQTFFSGAIGTIYKLLLHSGIPESLILSFGHIIIPDIFCSASIMFCVSKEANGSYINSTKDSIFTSGL